MARMNKISLNDPEKDKIIIPTANMYSSQDILVRIVKCVMPLYSLVMSNITVLLNYYRLIRTTNKKMNFKLRPKCILIYRIFEISKNSAIFNEVSRYSGWF